jgi:hypothetical protein
VVLAHGFPARPSSRRDPQGRLSARRRVRRSAVRRRNAAVQVLPNKQASACTTAALCLGALGPADRACTQGYPLVATRPTGARVQSEAATRRPGWLRWRSSGAAKHL